MRSQTFTDYEHIVIDGESTDQTKKILQSFNQKYYSAKPRGIANAMNIGLSHAHGQYVYFLNSDDSFYDSNVLQKVHNFLLQNPILDWAFGNIHETTGKKTIGFPPKRKIFQGQHPYLLKFYNYIPHQGAFVHKGVFDQFGGFDEKLTTMMDPDFWLRISFKTNWNYMPIVVANYLIRSDSQSENIANAEKNRQEYITVQSRYLSKLEFFFAKIINRLLS